MILSHHDQYKLGELPAYFPVYTKQKSTPSMYQQVTLAIDIQWHTWKSHEQRIIIKEYKAMYAYSDLHFCVYQLFFSNLVFCKSTGGTLGGRG